jgi:hypothetical protein
MTHASPTEAEVRAALKRALPSKTHAIDCLIEEFWIPRSNERADVAVVGSTLKAFEIKTARDSLKRLPRQSTAYARLFDECTAVVAERHLTGVTQQLPDWWGIWIIRGGSEIHFECLRSARRNPALDSETLVRLLWRDEALEALKELGAAPPATASRSWMWNALLCHLDEDDVRQTVTRALISRDPTQARIPTKRFHAPTDSPLAVQQK